MKTAAEAFKALNGLICVYKPTGVPVRQVRSTILSNICRDLNLMPDRPLEQRVEIVGATNNVMSVNLVPNYADHTLVCGPRYLASDIKCSWSSYLSQFTSGVLLLGINSGTLQASQIRLSKPIRAYKVHGQLGKATENFFWTGKTVERTYYDHVTREKVDKIVAHMQAAHQKSMYNLTGLHMESQATYELASRGLIRPANSKLPVLYGIRCVYFNPPNFTLEIQAMNEYERYLCTLVHDLGVQLKSSAHSTGVQCIRLSKFNLDMALLRKDWQLPNFIQNIEVCKKIIDENDFILNQESPFLNNTNP